MAEMLARAVQDRQRVPDEPMELLVDKETLILTPQVVEHARAHARRSGKLHNEARAVFARHVIAALTNQVADAIGTDPFAEDPLGGDDAPGDPMLLGPADLADIRADLEADPAVQAAMEWFWPILTPQQLLTDLFADAKAIASAAPELGETERALLLRAPGGWTPADVPLLDEAVELLGVDEEAERARLAAQVRQREAYAQGALDIAEGSRPLDVEDEEEPEILLAGDLLDAASLAERQALADYATAAERAAADRTWAFGHIIVDEAQELSPMAWRLLMRRSPSRSMTVVGDVAQTGDLGGASSWASVFGPYVADRWRSTELTVNYRTPAEIMALAGSLLATINPALRAPTSVRSTGEPPRVVRVEPRQLASALASAVRDDTRRLGGGRLAVIVPEARAVEFATAVRTVAPDAAIGADADLTLPVAVLTVRQAKGLEFDAVIVVDPGGIESDSPRGRSDLYVALTRATQRLTLVTDDWPAGLERGIE